MLAVQFIMSIGSIYFVKSLVKEIQDASTNKSV